MALRVFREKVHMLQHHMRGCVTFSTRQQNVVAVGIDFGCKNSRVAIMDSLVPQIVCSEIDHFTPSYVTFTRQNSYVPYEWGLQHLDRVGKRVAVGELAKHIMWRQPSDVVYNIKKLIGKHFEDSSIQEMRKRVHFSIIKGPGGEAWVEIHGMEFSPVDITTAIFAKLRDIVLMDEFHHELQAVISVPAFFDEQQKENIMAAAHGAGIKVLRLIDEPIAAALSGTTIESGTVIVFGLGAGSFSVTVLHVSPDKNFEIITQLNDTSLGGDQFDNMLVDYFAEEVLKNHYVDIRGDIHVMTILAVAVEQAKVELSDKSEVTISIPSFSGCAQGPIDLNVTISRQKFEELIDSLIEQTKVKCQCILEDAEIPVKDIGEVILSGGMTRVPKIRRTISEVFGGKQNSLVNPEEAVVMGSAIQAALMIEDEHMISDDMIPLSIGIESSEGYFTRVIPRHTTVPTTQTVKIPGWCAYGEHKRVRVFFGEHVMVQHNVPLGEIEVINYQSPYLDTVDFELTFEVDKDFVVKVSARNAGHDTDDGCEVFETFPIAKEDISKENVEKAVRKALHDWQMSATEVRARLRNVATHIMGTLADALSACKDKLPKELCEDAENVSADLQKSLDGDVIVLRHKMLSAKSMELAILNQVQPPASLLNDDSDCED